MGALVPGIHLAQQFIGLVDRKNWPLDARLQARSRHDDGDFQQAVGIGLQACHFAIEPDQVLVGFGKCVRGGVVGF
ncbi:hypothetical protein D3C87_2098050 [compost metagenome]